MYCVTNLHDHGWRRGQAPHMYVWECFQHVTFPGSHVAEPGDAELDAQRTSERREGDAEWNDKGHDTKHSVGKCLQQQLLLCPVHLRYQKKKKKRLLYLKVPRLCPLVLLIRTLLRWRWERSIGGMIQTGEKRSTGRKTCNSGTSSHQTHHMDRPDFENSLNRGSVGKC